MRINFLRIFGVVIQNMSIRKAFYSNKEIVKLAPNSKSNDARDDEDSTDFQIHAVQECKK